MTDEEIQALQSELESTKTELEGLKAEKEILTSELETKGATITELEQTVADRDVEITTLKQAIAELDGKSDSLNESLKQAVSAYKAVVVQANTSIPDELIAGDSIEVIDQSMDNAKSLLSKVRSSIEAEIASGKIPAGAPARTAPDLGSLSPREKIQYAITKGGK